MKDKEAERPIISPEIFKKKLFPLLDNNEKVFFIVIDNFRFDQWKMLAKEIGDLYDIEEDVYMSILLLLHNMQEMRFLVDLCLTKLLKCFQNCG